MTPDDLLTFGIMEMAYIAGGTHDGVEGFFIRYANGNTAAFVANRGAAIELITSNQMDVATLH